MTLELRNIRKTYDGELLLRGITFSVHEKETICLLGPSGSGKSTLLGIIAGLEEPDSGEILWDGKDLAVQPAHLRDFGLVFQDYALFPHLDVFDNVAFGLKMRDWAKSQIVERVSEVLRLVDLDAFGERKVTDLSGGEQQRVALARALAPRPRLLMFDEPLGALDRALREDLLGELRDILHRTGIPALYVTHDQEEAFTIAERVLLLHVGEIVREGKPSEVWGHPGSAWVAEFLGLGTVIDGTCELRAKQVRVKTRYGVFDLKCMHKHRTGDRISLLIRPTAVQTGTPLSGLVKDVLFEHDNFKVVLENGIYFYSPKAPEIGKKMSVKIKIECLGQSPSSKN